MCADGQKRKFFIAFDRVWHLEPLGPFALIFKKKQNIGDTPEQSKNLNMFRNVSCTFCTQPVLSVSNLGPLGGPARKIDYSGKRLLPVGPARKGSAIEFLLQGLAQPRLKDAATHALKTIGLKPFPVCQSFVHS